MTKLTTFKINGRAAETIFPRQEVTAIKKDSQRYFHIHKGKASEQIGSFYESETFLSGKMASKEPRTSSEPADIKVQYGSEVTCRTGKVRGMVVYTTWSLLEIIFSGTTPVQLKLGKYRPQLRRPMPPELVDLKP